MTINKQSRSRLSFAREHPELAQDNPLNIKTPNLTQEFELYRCEFNAKQLAGAAADEAKRRRELEAFKAKRRIPAVGSAMVQKQNPHPELKPSPELSRSVKTNTHLQELEHERWQLDHDHKLAEGKAIAGELREFVNQLQHEAKLAKEITRPQQGKTLGYVEKETFKLMRRIHERGENVISKSQSFRHSIGH